VTASLADRERTAVAKGASLAAQVTRVKYGLYQVPSQSEPGVYWTVVERADGGLQCTCGAGFSTLADAQAFVSARVAA